MHINITKHWVKSFFIMLFAVLMMGFSLSLLVMTELGTDPCSSMNYGVARLVGLTFGTYQLIFNLVLLLFVILFYRSCIGWGTLGNMVLVGYTADFFTYIWHDVCNIPMHLPLTTRIIILVPALIVFVIAAACYMNSGHGMSPYDALPFIIDETIMKKTGGKSHFKPIRFSQDLLCTIIAVITGGEAGAITVLMVLSLAPTVQFVGKIFDKKLHMTESTGE